VTLIVPASPTFGIAYFGVRDPDLYRADLDTMAAQGFDWVLLPFTHDDAAWESSTFRDLVASAEARGLDAVISPWGGAWFGGEGVQTELSIAEWLRRARDTGARFLHVDEPVHAPEALAEALAAWADDASVWLTIQPTRAAELDPTLTSRVAVVGTDAYDGSVDERVEATRAFGIAAGRLDLAWVRAFRIEAGRESEVGASVVALAGVATRVGVWAWKGATGRGELRSANPALVQESVAAAIRLVREAASTPATDPTGLLGPSHPTLARGLTLPNA
jgi:hypothetical protein